MELSPSTVAQVVLYAHELKRAEPELRAFINGLTEDEKVELVALAWIGRDSFDKDEWADAVMMARQEATTPTEDYLLGMPHMADHLESGAEALGMDLSTAEEALL